MTSKIFKSIMSVALLVLLASIIIITGGFYQYFGTTQQAELKDELSLAVNATEQLGKDYLENLDFERYRLTWINADGSVIFDSHADATMMENHGDREEIKEALLTGTGSSTRRSSTLTEKTIYEASRLDDGTVLRISVSRATALMLVLGMIQPIAVVLILAIILSILLSKRMAKRVVEPLNNLNLEKSMENNVYEELTPLLNRIHAQQQEIKNQMQALKRKQDEFNQITDNMKEGLVLLDSTNKIISINPAARILFGVCDTCIGEDFLNLEDKQDMRQAIYATIEQGHSYFRANKNGREYQFDLSRIESDGTIQGLVILAFDITEQVNAEKNRREFTANVSHELKTPLQSIIGSAELMENGIVKADDMPMFISRIRKEASRLVFLIDDIIRLSQLDENIELPHEDVSLRILVEEVCDTLSDASNQKNITLHVLGDEGIVHGVPRLLYEIIYNLCDNAIKYNHTGGNVQISIRTQFDSVVLTVQDSGIGIPLEHQEKIFERFYRIDKSHSKQSGGTGLGLSIVKHAILYHHAKLDIQSEPGKGTTISVTFNTKNE